MYGSSQLWDLFSRYAFDSLKFYIRNYINNTTMEVFHQNVRWWTEIQMGLQCASAQIGLANYRRFGGRRKEKNHKGIATAEDLG